MELTKMNDKAHKGVKSQKPGMAEATVFDETHSSANHSATQQEVIKDSKLVTLRTVSSSDDGKVLSKEKEGSPEPMQRLSRTETVRQDARKLKAATLNRMGKMFKQRSQTPVGNKSSLNVDGGVSAIKSVENCAEDAPRKDKSNSLGRMLKLVDKDGSPKKLFHPRAGSLSRILRRHPNNENNDDKKPAEDNSPGIFSRMLSQLKGRPHSGNTSNEPNIRTCDKMCSLPPKAPLKSKPANLPSSMSATPSSPPPPPPPQATGSPQQLTNLEYSI